VTQTAGESVAETPAEQAVVIRPRTTTVRIGSSPRGAPVVFAGTRTAAPLIAEHAVGFETILSAERTFRQDGERYRFKGWSDDVRKRERVVTVPRQGLDVRARYVPAAR